ncbi:MAG: hypothetical protein ACI915_005596 [Gammaproteobacteria bacterium]|jgi:hypothetical protein
MTNGIYITLLWSIVWALSGCASQTTENYVSKDVLGFISDLGPPDETADIGNGQREFRWSRILKNATPTHTSSSSAGSLVGANLSYLERTDYEVSVNGTISGGHSNRSTCTYQLLASWDEPAQDWVVDDINGPGFSCE